MEVFQFMKPTVTLKTVLSSFDHLSAQCVDVLQLCASLAALGVRVVDLQPRHYIVEVFAVFRITGVPLYFQGAPLADEHADGGTHVRSSGRHVSLHRGDSSYLTLNRPYSLSR